MSDIEEDIEMLEEFTKLNIIYPCKLGLTETQYNLLKEGILNILEERKQDKKKIKELEKENKKYIIKLTDAEYNKVIELAQEDIKKQFRQKIKNKIEEYNKKIEQYNVYRKTECETDVEYYENMINTEIKKVLEELITEEENK